MEKNQNNFMIFYNAYKKIMIVVFIQKIIDLIKNKLRTKKAK